jgi:internalin A
VSELARKLIEENRRTRAPFLDLGNCGLSEIPEDVAQLTWLESRYWLDLVDVLGGHSPVLIFQNEKGGRSKAIDIAGIKGRYDNVRDRYSGNLEHAAAADVLRDAVEFFAANLGHIGEELPARWIAIRADIEARAAELPYISQQEYFGIYGRHIPFDRKPALHLSRYLHDLGVFLHFQDDPLLARTVILQNGWATEAVFRILDDEIVKARFGRFTAADCERLWRDSVYADMHPELLALMQRFELCYVVADSAPRTWLAPQLLPPARPTALSTRGRPTDAELVVRYHYDFLPKGMISRLTVRMHRFVRDPEMAWNTGVLFEMDDTSVLVELLPAGNEIELRARAPERKALISAISTDLDSLNESFRGLADKVDKRIPCICDKCRGRATPHFYDQKKLRRRVEDRRLTVECPDSYEDVDVVALLDGIRQAVLPEWAVVTPNRVIDIFLASSSELRADRDAFDLGMRRLNDVCACAGSTCGSCVGNTSSTPCRRPGSRTSTTRPSADATFSSACSSTRRGPTPPRSSRRLTSSSRAPDVP